MIYQRPAIFSPGQINFEFELVPNDIKLTYIIDRKSLEFTQIMLVNWTVSGWKGLPPTTGKCSIMKTPPTAGNQI